jgi:hypothetical protein
LKWPLRKAVVYVSGKVNNEIIEIIKSQLNVKEVVIKDGELKVELDVEMDDELKAEGFARVVSRVIQSERKKAGLVKEDSISLEIVSKDISKLLQSQKDFIKNRVGAKDINVLEIASENTFEFSVEEKSKDAEFLIRFNKVR